MVAGYFILLKTETGTCLVDEQFVLGVNMLASLKENGETQPLATLQSVIEEV